MLSKARYKSRDIKKQVEALLQEAHGLEPISKDFIASCLCITPRTLSRKLKDQDTFFQALLDGERKRRCMDYMKKGIKSGNELSDLLGYSSPSYFYTSFKKWTGEKFSNTK